MTQSVGRPSYLGTRLAVICMYVELIIIFSVIDFLSFCGLLSVVFYHLWFSTICGFVSPISML